MARFLAALAAALAAAAPLAAPPRADAAAHVRYGLADDAWLMHGPGSLESRLQRLQSLGVQIVRFSLRWDEIAATEPASPTSPDDPAYDWADDDAVVNGLRAHGIEPLLQLVGTPAWANGDRAPNWAPSSAATFGAFATAAARRYPWVRRWLVWNEPNQARWLRPTLPAVYVTRLLNPAYAALHRTIRSVQVAGGGTAPRAATGGVSPVAWLTAMRAAHARLDAYAHNPYPLDPKRESPLRGGCRHCSTLTMATVDRLASLVSRNFPRARIWLTEYGYQSNPPDRLLGVSPALQARYVGEGAYAAYRTPLVDVLVHFLYRDEPDLARFQSGLVTLGGRAKPALDAFRLPLAETSRRGGRVTLWGQVRAPDRGATAWLQRRASRGWWPIARLSSGASGIVSWNGSLPRGAVVRLRAGPLVGAALTLT